MSEKLKINKNLTLKDNIEIKLYKFYSKNCNF